MTRKAFAALAVLAVVVAIVGVAGLLRPAPADATSHQAVRSFSAPGVLPGGTLEVKISVGGYGPFGQVVETLPDGFSYEDSSLTESAVRREGQMVAFTFLGVEEFTYTVTAPGAEGAHSFTGILLDMNKVEEAVGGANRISVTLTPVPTAMPGSAAPLGVTVTREPAPRLPATAVPTVTPRPKPTVRPRPTATWKPAAVPTFAPKPRPTATPVPRPPAPPEEGGRISPAVWVALAVVAALAVAGAAGFALWRRRYG